jgi:hypothetical protein
MAPGEGREEEDSRKGRTGTTPGERKKTPERVERERIQARVERKRIVGRDEA